MIEDIVRVDILSRQNTEPVGRIAAVMIIIFDFNFDGAAVVWPFHSSDLFFIYFRCIYHQTSIWIGGGSIEAATSAL